MNAAVCLGFFPNRHAKRDANFDDFISTLGFPEVLTAHQGPAHWIACPRKEFLACLSQ